jgi:hypothetical protein
MVTGQRKSKQASKPPLLPQLPSTKLLLPLPQQHDQLFRGLLPDEVSTDGWMDG